MTPSNPTNGQPFIYRIMDALGITHLVVAVQHSHLMSEIEGLVTALAGKADTNHTHKLLQYNPSSSPDGYAGFSSSGNGNFIINVQESKSIYFMFGAYVKADITNTNVDNFARALRDPDTEPIDDSDDLITSGAVAAALAGKQNALTFDSTPTTGSANPVTSGGVKAALDGKAPAGDTEVVFEEGENISVYLPSYFTNGERQRSFILNYQGEVAELLDLFRGDTDDTIRLLSHDDSIITVAECYIAVRVIKQSGIGAQGDTYYIIFDGKNEY